MLEMYYNNGELNMVMFLISRWLEVACMWESCEVHDSDNKIDDDFCRWEWEMGNNSGYCIDAKIRNIFIAKLPQ